MAIFVEEIEVVIKRQNQSRLCPKRHANQIMFPGNRRRPHIKRVGYQARHRRIGPGQARDQLVDVSRENMNEALHKLVMIQGAVEP